MSLVQANNLNKTYGDSPAKVTALDELSFFVKKGEFVAIMGPSGSGKTTLLQLLGGLDRPTSGSVFVEGVDISSLTDDGASALRRRKIGFVFQFYNLIPVLTAAENVAFPLLLDGAKPADISKAVEEMLRLVGLWERRDHLPNQLSGGERQRVGIARALVTRPTIVLADEPTGNLDSVAAEEIMKLLKNCAEQLGQTVIVVTHDPKMAAFADRLVFLKDGRLVDEESLGGRIDRQVLADKLGNTAGLEI